MKVCLTLITLFFAFTIYAQTPEYWQQEVNYSIEVTLNDNEHTLEGQVEMAYTNNSPDDLDFIYIHLWPNAYKNRQTAFAKQKLESGSTKFHYALPSERGYIDSLDFTAWGKTCQLVFENEQDYAKLMLPSPLKSGETTLLKTPFYVKIPESFSRLGHVEQSYQLTQWYPKPAVYDAQGWHPMPYLDQGEFYSEYGCFDVKITLPSNYVVGATGDLQTQSEIDFLNELAEKTAKIDSFGMDTEFPPTADEFKTLNYSQCDVHDFAWFADKRFHVLKGKAALPDTKREVTLWAMFTDFEAELWKNSIEYLHDGTMFYSARVGEYPYNQVTAVQSALSAGAGMEYPTITVIGESYDAEALEDVIVHEVGHNWFYGQLGSNERTDPWMDEGFNSYYDQRYKREKYPDLQFKIPPPFRALVKPNKLPSRDVWEMGYQWKARKHRCQAIGCHSADFTDSNYGLVAYIKTAIALDYLAAYLGQKKFDDIMHKYYSAYEFKHVHPVDVKTFFENETKKDLGWFFDDLVKTEKNIDYHLWKVDKNAEQIGNHSFHHVQILNSPKNIAGPFTLSAVKNGEVVETVWYDGFKGMETVLFPAHDYDEMVLDYHHEVVEYNRKNNTIKNKGLLKKVEPLKLRMLPNWERGDKTQLYLTPLMAYNKHDKFMLGLATYNQVIPTTNFEYSAAVFYAFGSKSVNWLGQAAYNIYPEAKAFERIRFNVPFSSFSDGDYWIRAKNLITDTAFDYHKEKYKYYRFAPEMQVEFGNKSARSKISKTLKFRHINIFKQDIDGSKYLKEIINNDTLGFNSNEPVSYTNEFNDYINELSFVFKNNRRLLPYGFGATIEQHKNFVKAKAEGVFKWTYPKMRKGVTITGSFEAIVWDNIFGVPGDGSLGDGDFETYKLNITDDTENDYKYDHLMGHRHLTGSIETNSIFAQQITNTKGFHYLRTNATDIGISEKWQAFLNIKIDAPYRFRYMNIAPEITIGVNDRSISQSNYIGGKHFDENGERIGNDFYQSRIMAEFGLSIEVIPGAFELFLPIFYSEDLKYDGNEKYFRRISFMLNLDKLNPIKFARKLDL